jgi:type II secretory pathway pseudopilin PulG
VKPRSCTGVQSASRNRGFALIAFVLLLVLVAGYVVAAALNRTGSELASTREDRNMNALNQAKAALIAYAASEEWQLYKALPQTPPTAYVQPGSLPCPDQDNDGDADCWTPYTSSMIGRLPWKTIGSDDLRDASGEGLWYALSQNFRKYQCPPNSPGAGCTTINSDTQGQLTVTGTALGTVPTTNVVAIIFAPGLPVQGQVRDAANINSAASYLEGLNLGDPVNYIVDTTAPPSNDRLLTITQAELMAAVEPAAAAKIEHDVKPLLQDYFNKWHAYPFAVPWPGAGPPALQSAYLGVAGQTEGLLPLTNTPPSFDWLSSPIAVTQIAGGTGSSTVTGWNCSLNSSPLQVVCRIDYSGGSSDRPAIKMEIPISNVHLAFADTPSVPDPWGVTMTDRFGNTIVPNPPPYGPWSQSSPSFIPTLDFQALADRGTVLYTGRLPNAGVTSNRVFITVLLPAPPALLPKLSGASMTWFFANQWFRLTYYAMSPGYAPGGGASCVPSGAPLCLTVNNLPSPTDKRAILVLAGRNLSVVPRPSGNFAAYLEGANLTAANGTAPYIYEHRFGTPASGSATLPTGINDRVVVLGP